jgi:hypothetical protein
MVPVLQQQQLHALSVNWLSQKVLEPNAEGLHDELILNVPRGSHQHGAGGHAVHVQEVLDSFRQLEAAHRRHLDVAHHQPNLALDVASPISASVLLHCLQRFFAAGRCEHDLLAVSELSVLHYGVECQQIEGLVIHQKNFLGVARLATLSLLEGSLCLGQRLGLNGLHLLSQLALGHRLRQARTSALGADEGSLENGAHFVFGLHRHVASELARDHFADAESEADPVDVGVGRVVEGGEVGEQPLDELRLHSRAFVQHREHHQVMATLFEQGPALLHLLMLDLGFLRPLKSWQRRSAQLHSGLLERLTVGFACIEVVV